MTARRDRRGRFIKGNVPWNKRLDSTCNKQCVHHWIIDRFDVGTCKKCGEVRDFGKLLVKLK